MKNLYSLFLAFLVSISSFATVNLTKYDFLNESDGLAIWLRPSWKTGMQKYVFENNSGQLSEFADGSALITGKLVNKSDATERFYIEIPLKNKKTWAQQTAANGNFCDPQNLTAGQHTNWTYYDIDADEDPVLEDLSGNYGDFEMTLTGSSSCGIQIGYGANGVNAIYGLGGMFSGQILDELGEVLYSTSGGFCTAICPKKNVDDYFDVYRFDYTDIKPYSHALYINDDNLGVQRFVFGSKGGKLTTYQDGTAHLYGEVYMISNNSDGVNWVDVPEKAFEVNMYFHNAKDWSDWSATSGNIFYDTYNKSNGSHTDWTYYILDPSKPNTLTGRNNYKGTVLNLSHQPANLTIAMQLGKAATSQNTEVFGLGGWFTYTVAKASAQYTGGRGDVNVYAKRNCNTGGDNLFGIKGGKSAKNKRIYHLDGANASIETSDIPFKSAALADDPNSSYLYFIQNVHPYNLGRYNLENGTSEIVGTTGFCNNVYRLAFNSQGTLFASRGKKVYTINTTTGAASFYANFFGFKKGQKKGRGDIAFDSNDNMYLLTKSHLFSVNSSNCKVTAVGRHGISLISGMDFNSSGDLYVSNIIKTKGVGVHSNIYTINTGSAASTLIGDAKVRINDLTFYSGCYTTPEERTPSCITPVKSKKSNFAYHSGVIEYDDDFSDLEEDEDLIAQEELENISLFPTLISANSGSFFTVSSTVEYENVSVSITNGVGQQMMNTTIDYLMSESTIDIGDLPTGMYFVNINLGGASKVEKIMISK